MIVTGVWAPQDFPSSCRFEILLALTNIASLSDELREFMVENEVSYPNGVVIMV